MNRNLARFGIVLIALIVLPLVYLRLADGGGPAETDQVSSGMTIETELLDESGERVGVTTLTAVARGVLIEVEVTDLPAGRHGFHIHETGLCEPAGFASAGGHFNPTGKEHGMENPRGPHAGDLPNIIVGEDGTGSLTVLNPYLSLGDGTDTDLLRGDGTAVMIHAGPDDYRTDPAGDSGARIACGVIR